MQSLTYRDMREDDIEPLADVLLHSSVYEHIGGLPSRPEFCERLRRSLAGPSARLRDEQWLNFVVMLETTGQVVGRLEATLHHELAEVAFLYGPEFWGRGYATHGLRWLHETLRGHAGVVSLWGTTVPNNTRSAALLRRCGYQAVDDFSTLPLLHSYDPGDLVFTRPVDNQLTDA